MQAQGIRIAGLTGLGGTVGIFNTTKPIETMEDMRACVARHRSHADNSSRSGALGGRHRHAGIRHGPAAGHGRRLRHPPVVALMFQHTRLPQFYTDAGSGEVSLPPRR